MPKKIRKTKNRKSHHEQKNYKKDPYYAREAQTYEHPVPSREYILSFLRERKKPASFEQLFESYLGVENSKIIFSLILKEDFFDKYFVYYNKHAAFN